MKNLKIKVLTLGVLATLVVASTPTFAATGTSSASTTKTTKTIATSSVTTSTSKTPTIPGTMQTASNPYATSIYFDGPGGQLRIKGSNGFDYIFYISTVTVGYGYETSGYGVEALQLALNHYGYNVGVDSQFGGQTYSALVNFQYAHGLSADGICGPNTWTALANNF
jgi:peptidoglycan hydrolase-like protein with peptidoglycan-binding domain